MKIVRLQAYYTQEKTSGMHLVNDLHSSFVQSDIEVEVITPLPSRGISKEIRKEYKNRKYEEKDGGKLTVRRFSMFGEGRNPVIRALRYLFCGLAHYFKGKKSTDADVVFVGSTPPTQGLVAAKVAKKLSRKGKKKVPFVFHLQDMFPESLVSTGLSKKGSLLYRIGNKISRYTYDNADAIIVISEDIKKSIIGKGVPSEKVHLVRNWIDINAVAPIEAENNSVIKEFGLSESKFRVVYAGNLGLAQGVGVIVDAAELMKDDESIEFVIFGNGAEKEKIQSRIVSSKLTNIKLFPLQPAEKVSEVYSAGDACIITCKKGVGIGSFPSKTVTIMACGRPIIACFDSGTEMQSVIEDNKCGVMTEPENAEMLADTIRKLSKSKEACKEYGNNARTFVEKNLTKEICTRKIIGIIEGVSNRGVEEV